MQSLFSNKRTVSVAPSSIIFTVGFLLSLYFLFQVRSTLILVFLAFIISVALSPMSRFFEHKLRLGRIPGVMLAYVVSFILLTLFVALVVPPLANEMYQLLKRIDLPVPLLEDQVRNFNFSFQEINELVPRLNQSVSVLMQMINTAFNSVFTFFTLVVLSFYLMLEKDRLHLRMYWFTKDKEAISKAQAFITSVEKQLGGWVRGQLLLMLVVGVLTYVGLLALGIPYAMPLALLAGLLEIVPNVGPTVAAIPAVFIGFTTGGPIIGGLTLLLAIAVQQLENNVLVPKIMSANANVNPLAALILILIGLKIAGVIGALLAIPVYIVLRATYSVFFQDKLAS